LGKDDRRTIRAARQLASIRHVAGDLRRNEHLSDGFTGLFAAVRTPETMVQQLFDQLITLAQAQGFGIAAELDFIDNEEVTYAESYPGRCGAQFLDDEAAGCGALED
jgi:hypothetical protein